MSEYTSDVLKELPRESVSWTGYELKELRGGVDKVEYLRDEEEEEGLAEETEDSRDRQNHTSKVAEGVTNKHLGRVPRWRGAL